MKDRPISSSQLRKYAALVKKHIYLDNAATGITPAFVLKAQDKYYRQYCVNVERSNYRLAQEATRAYDAGRKKTAVFLLNCAPEEFIFTRNFTEAANLAAYALEHPLLDRRQARLLPHTPLIRWNKNDNIVATFLEHHSNLMPWMRLANRLGIELRMAEPTKEGLLTPEAFERVIDKKTKLVAFQHASNALGTVHPVIDIVRAVRKASSQVLIFVDGAQAVGHMPVDFKSLRCDFYAFSGHKGPLGPKGTGGLVVRKELLGMFHPFFLGGGTVLDITAQGYKLREDFGRFEGGTPNIPGLIGLGEAAFFLSRKIGLPRIRAHELALMGKLLRGIEKIKGVELYGHRDIRFKTGILSFNLKGWLCHDVSLALDEKWNILTRAGHHCCIPAMRFYGLLDSYGGTVRVSLHYYNTESEIDRLLRALEKLAR